MFKTEIDSIQQGDQIVVGHATGCYDMLRVVAADDATITAENGHTFARKDGRPVGNGQDLRVRILSGDYAVRALGELERQRVRDALESLDWTLGAIKSRSRDLTAGEINAAHASLERIRLSMITAA